MLLFFSLPYLKGNDFLNLKKKKDLDLKNTLSSEFLCLPGAEQPQNHRAMKGHVGPEEQRSLLGSQLKGKPSEMPRAGKSTRMKGFPNGSSGGTAQPRWGWPCSHSTSDLTRWALGYHPPPHPRFPRWPSFLQALLNTKDEHFQNYIHLPTNQTHHKAHAWIY